METKLYKNVEGEKQPFLVFHISDDSAIPDLKKFVGGNVEVVNEKHIMTTKHGSRRFDIGDYIVYLTNQSPFSRIRIVVDKVRHQLPKDSFLICKPEEFFRNFKEV